MALLRSWVQIPPCPFLLFWENTAYFELIVGIGRDLAEDVKDYLSLSK